MKNKLMVLFTRLILLSLLMPPAGTVRAQTGVQNAVQECPPYKEGILNDKDFLHSLPLECIRIYKEATQQANLPTGGRDAQPLAVGVPDSFGYAYDSSVGYHWISASTNSGLIGDDEFTGPIDIGFSFPFYGLPQTQLYFNTNGLITFGAGSREWGGVSILNDANPNNFIAPFWDDLLVGSPYGAIYYSRGGSAPNRYIVIEWRSVESYTGIGATTFEAILYENGDIVVQHSTLPSPYYAAVGIEDSSGHQGLQYQALNCCLWAPEAIRFYYPTTPAARILAYSPQPQGFAPLYGHKDFPIVVTNTGTLGTDTYNLSAPLSSWSGKYYAADGVTLLSDTNGDSLLDTGPLPQGGTTTVIARYLVPAGAKVSDIAGDFITITSSLNSSVKSYIKLYTSIPAQFANVFVNNTDGAMSFLTVSPERTDLYKASTDNYFGSDIAVAQLPNVYYFYVWNKGFLAGGSLSGDIEYALLDRQGNLIRTPDKLTDNAGAALYTWDDSPSVAVTPSGTVGVVWRRYLYNNATDKYNYNIYFATLNAAGARLTGPTNITNNLAWGGSSIYNIPQFYSPTVAATSDNRFILGWEDYRRTSSSTWMNNVWYAVRNVDGTLILSAKALTNDGRGKEPILNSLTGGKVIMTWRGDVFGPYYAVISSNGSISKAATALRSDGIYQAPDAVQLPNGKTAIAWTIDGGMELSILNSSYNIESERYSGSDLTGTNLSLTTDASSRVIMTWINGPNKQVYALANGNGGFLIDPIVYNKSNNRINVSLNGQGNAPYEAGVVATFYDVQPNYWAASFVERLYTAAITGGCAMNPLQYCPETTVTRAQMAVFLERGIHSSSYNPPAVGTSTGFGDVSTTYWAAAWIKQLAAEGITGGCGSGNYCSESPVTRAQIAVFLLRSKYGASYTPPAVAGSTGFSDVDPSYWAGAWIKELVAEGIAAGCGMGTYCPESPVTRAQMAVFLVRTFNLP